MAREKKEIPYLPSVLWPEQKKFDNLTIEELFSLFDWATERLQSRCDKWNKKLELLKQEQIKVQAELSVFGDTPQELIDLSEQLKNINVQINTLISQKKETEAKVETCLSGNTTIMPLIKKLQKLQKKEVALTSKR